MSRDAVDRRAREQQQRLEHQQGGEVARRDDGQAAATPAAPNTEPHSRVHHVVDEMPRIVMTRRRVLAFGLFIAAALAFFYFVLPEIGGMKDSWDRVGKGDHVWLAAAFGFEIFSMISYIAIFHGIHVPPGSPITWRESYLITMASLAATRLFSAGGAGGVALTAWALRRSGMERREVAERMIAFLVLLYGVYLLAMIVCGLGLYTGLFHGPAPFGLTMVPLIVAVVGIAIVAPLALLPDDVERRIERLASRSPRAARVARRLAAGPASAAGGVRYAIYRVRHPDLAMIGVITWWAFNVAVLWAAFRAFGDAPPMAVVIQAYFVGMLGNLLPLPAGIGGVDGGMIGALVAFGVGGGLAVVAVLAYRLLAFWLPTIPGAIAYLQLRRRVHQWQSEPAAA